MSTKKNSEKIDKEKIFKKWGIKIVPIIIGVLLGVGLTFIYIKNFGIPFSNLLQNTVVAEEAKALENTIKKVGKLINLPKDETPAMATIIDIEELKKEEAFYADAKNGDIVLMYEKALKAIIYSPEKDIIVNVGPIYVSPNGNKIDETLSQEEDPAEPIIEE